MDLNASLFFRRVFHLLLTCHNISYDLLNAVWEWFLIKYGRVSVSRKGKKFHLLKRHSKMMKKNPIPSQTYEKNESYIMTMFVLKKIWFLFPLITEGRGRAELEDNNSIETRIDAHMVVLFTSSHFFCMKWALLRRKKRILKIHLMIKGKQNFKHNKIPCIKIH